MVSGDVRSLAITGSSATDKIFVAGKFDQVITADGEHTLNSKNLVSYPSIIACRRGSICVAEPEAVGFAGVGAAAETESAVQTLHYDALSNKLAVGGKFASIPVSSRAMMTADNIASLDVETNTFSALGGARGTVTKFAKQASPIRAAASKFLFTQADNYVESRTGRRSSIKTSSSGSNMLEVAGKVAKLDLASGETSARSETGAEGGDVLGLATCGTSEVMVGNYATFNGAPAGEGAGFCDAASLAVELTTFDIRTSDHENVLLWSTSSETNNSGFEIQRSIDGLDFATIAFVSGFGTTETENDYRYIDNIDMSTINSLSYRLKQIDFDGTTWFSHSIEATLNVPRSLVLKQNYPNPFNPSTSIKFSLPQAENVKLEVFNSVGQKVASIVDGIMEAGHHKINFDASGYSSGVYLYSLTSGESTIQKIMTTQK